MVQHTTLRIDATGTGTRVLALVVDAGTRTIAVGILHTLGTAAAVRITEVLGKAGTGAGSIAFTANGIGTTWTRVAGITWLFRLRD